MDFFTFLGRWLESNHLPLVLLFDLPRYADSRWCLEELVEILNFHKEHECHGHVLFPIFFKVGAGEVRKQIGAFGDIFKQYCDKERIADSQIKKWETALKEAGTITGLKYHR